MRLFLPILFFVLTAMPLFAAVDIAPRGKDPVRITDVYQQGGVPYIAVEDALDAVGLSGHWNSIKHVFLIRSARGWAEISPASGYLKLGEDYYPLREKPRFIDGRLRVTDSFVLNQLSLLVGKPIYFNNLDPDSDTIAEEEPNSLEQLFAFLLNKKVKRSGPLIRAVAIDPGHGGLDTGAIAENGFKEKAVNLKVAEKLTKQLKMKLGIPIYLSRDGDYELTLEQRLAPASKEDVDIWLLLHAQASLSAQPRGVNLFIRPEEGASVTVAEEEEQQPVKLSESHQLAAQLAQALREAGIEVNGIYRSSLLSLGRGDLPTVQVELGYLSHPEELKSLQDDEYQERLAQALYQGIRYYAKAKKESVQ
ncbi:N-acetylmuramoyl-L-alanine amidase [Malonomonas rubra DSM 5091]|uniref:N-acetylmuramoyl-L-alanine amidase n=1 Tax=Malonomonas rubra DSM 5091 TaxID=1122189 RepID=A0A1M6DKV7_MALRU|nr:N-acetylmuramoyl-L-alanine amidase [Malonomonas rubra]SHI73791.1 N-acetylmuramoyl-L-alanine amidase [Malonomonas rubra DSM 5091]